MIASRFILAAFSASSSGPVVAVMPRAPHSIGQLETRFIVPVAAVFGVVRHCVRWGQEDSALPSQHWSVLDVCRCPR